MDISQFEWDTIKPRRGFWKSTLTRQLPVLGPIGLIGGYFLTVLASNQQEFDIGELTIMLLIAELIVLSIVNVIWYNIKRATGEKLTHYKISSEGVEVDGKTIPLTVFQTPNIDDFLAKNALPYQEWQQPRPIDGKPLSLLFETNQGPIKLLFHEEYIRQKSIRTMQDYLHPQSTGETTGATL